MSDSGDIEFLISCLVHSGEVNFADVAEANGIVGTSAVKAPFVAFVSLDHTQAYSYRW